VFVNIINHFIKSPVILTSADAWVVGSLILIALLASALKIISAVTKMPIVKKKAACVLLHCNDVLFVLQNETSHYKW
jgi:hypothetical protein